MTVERQLFVKLWVIKYCLKIIYPKFNLYTFLVFLAIKSRVQNLKKLRKKSIMDTYKLKIVPEHIQKLLTKDYLDNNILVQLPKCLIISREQYIQLCSENLFYVDNGVLWVTIKFSSKTIQEYKKKKYSEKYKDNEFKYNFNFVTSELHKKLWGKDNACNIENTRVVPILGTKYLDDNVCVVCENEFYNLTTSFDVTDCDNIEITLHPIPSFAYAPRIAEAAEVNLIVNDFDLSNDFLKEVLSNYFEIPKLLTENDVICINLASEMTLKYQYKYLDLIESAGKIYFKVKKLINNENQNVDNELKPSMNGIQHASFIVKGVTQLTLGENIHLLRPSDKYFKADPKYLHLESLCPTGLRQKFDQMQETIKAFLNGELDVLASSLSSPILPMFLLTGAVGSGKHLVVKTLAKCNGLSCTQIDCNALQSSTAKQTESKISAMIQKAKTAAPTIILLDNFEVFAVDPENNEDCRIMEYFTNIITDLYQNYTKHPIIFIAVTTASELKPNILRIFLEKYHIPKLNSQQRYEMLQWMTSVMQLNIDGDGLIPLNKHSFSEQSDNSHISEHSKEVLQRVAAKCETFVYGDIDTLVHFALRESYLKQNINAEIPEPNMRFVEEENFVTALESIRNLQSQHLDAPKIPKVYWEDIGGLEKLKKKLMKTIEFPIKYPHLFKNSSLKRSGILLYGPPGCGKTLVAKAVSTELNVSFLSVKGPELLNMYIGQSEENVRKVFESARASSPCIVFLDELDALAPRRGAAGDSGGASDRVVSQLLAEVDGVATEDADTDTNSFVFIMGATNRPDLLEQSLLRPGRLDKLIYVGPYCGLDEKTSVLKALCRKYQLKPELNLVEVAAALPDRCTGADLMQVVSTARAAAVRDLVAKLKSGALKETELSNDAVILGIPELWQGVESFRPSVDDKDLAYYESLQSQL